MRRLGLALLIVLATAQPASAHGVDKDIDCSRFSVCLICPDGYCLLPIPGLPGLPGFG